MIAPVDDKGRFTEEAGKYAGKHVRDANKEIIEDLRRKGLLFYAGVLTHKYPVCWRCKTPLILRATPQWYIKVTQLKKRFLEEASKVNWVPEWAGYARFRNWLEGLRDWVISRQRYWGTPVPIWICESCRHRVVISSVSELEELSGRKVGIKDLHRPWIDEVVLKCPKCGGTMRRAPDVLDVWLDSGVAFYASLGYPLRKERFEKYWPVDFITEGHDQIAGWFFSLLRCGLITFDGTPYKSVLMHGFALDEKGREMHKSLGNYVAPQEVLEFEKGGRDVLRWYVLRNTVWEDLRFSWDRLGEVYDDLNIVWNVYLFASTYMNLDNFDPEKHPLERYLDKLKPEDRWIISRAERLTKEVTRYFENYEIHRAARLLRDFIIEDVSRWYVRLVRPRVWIEREAIEKITAYVTLYHVLMRFLVLAAPIIPFITEKIYLSSFRTSPRQPESIHMLPWPKPREDLIDEELEGYMAILRELTERSAALRMKAGIKIRQPLPALYVLSDDEVVVRAVETLNEVLASQANVKKVKVAPLTAQREYVRVRARPVMSVLGPKFKGEAELVASLISSSPADSLKEELEKRGVAVLEAPDGRKYEVTSEMVKFEEEYVEGLMGDEFSRGMIILDMRITRKELAEGFARDILRRIQAMRKELQLPVDAYITVEMSMPPEARELFEEYKEYIAGETRAEEIKVVSEGESLEGDLVKSWEIGEYKVVISIRRGGGTKNCYT